MRAQKFAVYTSFFFVHTVHHIYDTITEAVAVCNALNNANPNGSPVYRVKPVVTYMEV